jgi:hypothetical protein
VRGRGLRSSGNLVSGSLDWETNTDPGSPAKLDA